ncbi:beta-mannosidase, partial [Tremellales sp. Uapishka_1]
MDAHASPPADEIDLVDFSDAPRAPRPALASPYTHDLSALSLHDDDDGMIPKWTPLLPNPTGTPPSPTVAKSESSWTSKLSLEHVKEFRPRRVSVSTPHPPDSSEPKTIIVARSPSPPSFFPRSIGGTLWTEEAKTSGAKSLAGMGIHQAASYWTPIDRNRVPIPLAGAEVDPSRWGSIVVKDDTDPESTPRQVPPQPRNSSSASDEAEEEHEPESPSGDTLPPLPVSPSVPSSLLSKFSVLLLSPPYSDAGDHSPPRLPGELPLTPPPVSPVPSALPLVSEQTGDRSLGFPASGLEEVDILDKGWESFRDAYGMFAAVMEEAIPRLQAQFNEHKCPVPVNSTTTAEQLEQLRILNAQLSERLEEAQKGKETALQITAHCESLKKEAEALRKDLVWREKRETELSNRYFLLEDKCMVAEAKLAEQMLKKPSSFDVDLLERGLDGGREFALQVSRQVAKLCQSVHKDEEPPAIVLQLFLNITRVGQALVDASFHAVSTRGRFRLTILKYGSIQSIGELRTFCDGIIEAHELFSVIDIEGEMWIAGKIKEHVRLYSNLDACKVIFIGTSHDDGYSAFAKQSDQDNAQSKLYFARSGRSLEDDPFGSLGKDRSLRISCMYSWDSVRAPTVPPTHLRNPSVSSSVRDRPPHESPQLRTKGRASEATPVLRRKASSASISSVAHDKLPASARKPIESAERFSTLKAFLLDPIRDHLIDRGVKVSIRNRSVGRILFKDTSPSYTHRSRGFWIGGLRFHVMSCHDTAVREGGLVDLGDVFSEEHRVRSILLDQAWRFTQIPSETFPDVTREWRQCSKFPTSVHVELIASGKIPDPYKGLAEWDVQWVGEADWEFETTFKADTSVEGEEVDLVFEGLDTYCEIVLNGETIGEVENMFLAHRIPVKGLVKKDLEDNHLVLRFKSPWRTSLVAEEGNGGARAFSNGISARLYARKAQYHWGWDWGPVLMTIGTWKPVKLERYTYRFEDVRIDTALHHSHKKGSIEVALSTVPHLPEGATIEIVLRDKADMVLLRERGKGSKLKLEVDGIAPWWPVGYGQQPLYRLDLSLLDKDGRVLASRGSRVAFRQVEIVQEPLEEAEGTSFVFQINGVRIFIGGGCWIPADSFLTEIGEERYRAWVRLLVDGNQNMLRVWGGGVYEHEAFYDACDELGVLVWQDFMFACGLYPSYDKFNDSVRREAEQTVIRLRERPSVVIFAGSNEDYQMAEEGFGIGLDWKKDQPKDYMKSKFPARHIYETILPETVKAHSNIFYHRNSPYGGKTANDPTIQLWACNSTLHAKTVTVVLTAFDLDAGRLDTRSFDVLLSPNSSTEIWQGQVPGQPVRTSDAQIPKPIILGARMTDSDGTILARYANWPEPYKYLRYPKTELEIAYHGDAIVLSCDNPVKGIILEVEGEECTWSDQAIDLFPGDPQRVTVKGLKGRKVMARYLGDGSA